MKYRAIAVVVLVLCVISLAGAQISGAGISGLRVHDHSGAGKGGSTLQNVTCSNCNATASADNNVGLVVQGFSATQADHLLRIRRSSAESPLFSISPSGAVNITATVSSSKACQTGFTRVIPNFCQNNSTATTLLTRDACTQVASGVSDAIAYVVYMNAEVQAANATANRFSAMIAYSDSGCTTAITPEIRAIAQETAIAAGTPLSANTAYVIAKPSSIGGSVWVKQTDDAGNSSLGRILVVGYND